ncbi:hypothetical protein IW492_12170 [Enterococcus sp. BWB1-3]|uniref:hypothetical protein n=1 Tax=Enterococcus sp. BWB1-3 TaxID=2787713 RepID=UPI0019234E72|nr:hypothetical protein [Enterococcus sp. BWB1-3]MBL1229990.1 hypothetical protein [Enterococcus sp. BWB1-3]
MKRNRIYLFIIIALSVVPFWYVHRSPISAVRTKVFSLGFFDIGIHSTVEKVSDDLYTIEPAPVEDETLGELKTYQVKRYGIFYLAEYYGEV